MGALSIKLFLWTFQQLSMARFPGTTVILTWKDSPHPSWICTLGNPKEELGPSPSKETSCLSACKEQKEVQPHLPLIVLFPLALLVLRSWGESTIWDCGVWPLAVGVIWSHEAVGTWLFTTLSLEGKVLGHTSTPQVGGEEENPI